MLEKAAEEYKKVLDSDGDPLLFYHAAERGSIVLRKLKRHKDDLEFLNRCVEKLGSLPTFAGTESMHIDQLKLKLNERIEKVKQKSNKIYLFIKKHSVCLQCENDSKGVPFSAELG